MKTTINIKDPPAFPINLGITGENDYREIEFDVSAWKNEYQGGTVSVIYKRPDGEVYPVVVTEDGGHVLWKIADTDVSAAGRGAVELRIGSGAIIGKSVLLSAEVQEGLGSAGTPPSAPAQEWVQTVIESSESAAESAQSAAQAKAAAQAAVGKTSYIGGNGHWYEWDADTEAFVDTGVKANGDSGNYPLISNSTDATATLEMLANTEYVYSAGLTALTLTFGAAAEGYSTEYRIRFSAGENAPTVVLPNTVIWSPCAPVFEAGKWYELSFVPVGSSLIGVWTAV